MSFVNFKSIFEVHFMISCYNIYLKHNLLMVQIIMVNENCCGDLLTEMLLFSLQIGIFYLFGVGGGLIQLDYIFRDDGYLYELFETVNATATFDDIQLAVNILDGKYLLSLHIHFT